MFFRTLADSNGNIAQIEAKLINGKMFVRFVKPGHSISEVRTSSCNKIAILHELGRVPDTAYDFFEGTPDEVEEHLAERGFV